MPEPYAVRMRPDGKRDVYERKADYVAGRARAKDAARKRRSRILGQ